MTNSRPGIRLLKKDWEGNPLSGAVFTLKDAEGEDVSKSPYTSASDGLITTAYLAEGTYTLTEVSAPRGYTAMEEPLTIRVGEQHQVSVSGGEESFYSVRPGTVGEMDALITVRNRKAAFAVRKVDAQTGAPIAGVHFALYRQVSAAGGSVRKDYSPMDGYQDLKTDKNGILPGIGMDLAGGTYYLTETLAAGGYDLLSEDLCFGLGSDGRVSVLSSGHETWLKKAVSEDTGETSYTIEISNNRMKKVRLKKVDIASPEGPGLAGASFDLYRADGGVRRSPFAGDLYPEETACFLWRERRLWSFPPGLTTWWKRKPLTDICGRRGPSGSP